MREFAFSQSVNGGRGRIRTDERTKRADLQSASFSHLDTLPCPKRDLQHVNKYSDGKWILGEFEKPAISVVALGRVPPFLRNVK